MNRGVTSKLAYAYYVIAVLIAAAAAFDEDPLDLWPRIGLGSVGAACIATGAILRTESLARRTHQLWVLGLGIGAATLAAFFAAPIGGTRRGGET
jgi:hypothetical protein